MVGLVRELRFFFLSVLVIVFTICRAIWTNKLDSFKNHLAVSRTLNDEFGDNEKFTKLLAPFAGTKIKILPTINVGESNGFGQELMHLFEKADWQVERSETSTGGYGQQGVILFHTIGNQDEQANVVKEIFDYLGYEFRIVHEGDSTGPVGESGTFQLFVFQK